MAVTVPLGVVLVIAVAWKLYQLIKAPHDRPLRAVTLCLVCAGMAFPFGQAAGRRVVDSAAGPGTALLLQNVLLLGAVYWLMCFYLHSASDQHQGRVRARWEAVPLVVAVAVISIAAVATPRSVEDRMYETADMRVTPVAVFYVVAGLYLAYALASALPWTWRYARMSTRQLATGLWLAAAGMAGMVAADVIRLVLVVFRWRGNPVPPVLTFSAGLLLAIAIPLFVIGITYPGLVTRIAALRIWRNHRRVYWRLHPLWTALHEVYPEDALHRVPVGLWSDRLSLRGVHRRYYRRVIECRDGLVRISPYVAQLGVHDDRTGTSSPALLAEHLRTALRTYAAGRPTPSTAVPMAMPHTDDLDADVQQLVVLADALRQE
ncbi:hypothetical protein BX285_5282 [Streptomyces sp. 1114.5]|nr:hypothetical protein BX285_5282 [Streptomyces sp. 1114.5]